MSGLWHKWTLECSSDYWLVVIKAFARQQAEVVQANVISIFKYARLRGVVERAILITTFEIFASGRPTK